MVQVNCLLLRFRVSSIPNVHHLSFSVTYQLINSSYVWIQTTEGQNVTKGIQCGGRDPQFVLELYKTISHLVVERWYTCRWPTEKRPYYNRFDNLVYWNTLELFCGTILKSFNVTESLCPSKKVSLTYISFYRINFILIYYNLQVRDLHLIVLTVDIRCVKIYQTIWSFFCFVLFVWYFWVFCFFQNHTCLCLFY